MFVINVKWSTDIDLRSICARGEITEENYHSHLTLDLAIACGYQVVDLDGSAPSEAVEAPPDLPGFAVVLARNQVKNEGDVAAIQQAREVPGTCNVLEQQVARQHAARVQEATERDRKSGMKTRRE